MSSLSGLVHIGLDILTTSVSDATNRILLQTGDVVRNATDSEQVEHWQHIGFVSRASKPEAGKKAAQAIVLKTSGRDAAIASVDQRGLALYGNLGHGETGLYAAGEDGNAQARVILKGDGSVNLYTTDTNTDEGQAVYFRVAKDAFQFVAPWGTLKFDATGLHCNHKSGAQFHLGGIYGIPAPLDQIASYAAIQAGAFDVTSSAASFGVAGQQPLANATVVAAQISSLQTQIKSIVDAITFLRADVASAAGAGVSSATPIIALGTAVTSAVAATSAAVLTIPSTTSSS